MRRHEISDEGWERIKGMLPGKEGDVGQSGKDNRQFINSVLWISKTGAPWRDLPSRFGNWNSVYQRFNRWSKNGVWENIAQELKGIEEAQTIMIDSTIIRAHQHAAGAKKKPRK